MYTAIIKTKEVLAGGQVRLDVEFSNGTDTFTEQVTPQDKGGFDYWVTSRLRSLNSVEELQSLDPATADPIEIPVKPEKTQAELDAEAWLKKYYRWVAIKKDLVDTGVVPISNQRVQSILSEVQTGLQGHPEYIDLIS